MRGPAMLVWKVRLLGLKMQEQQLRLLRPGGLAREDIEQHLGVALETHQTPGRYFSARAIGLSLCAKSAPAPERNGLDWR